MIYIMGILGFIGGFTIGQMLLFYMLRHKPKAEILGDPSLKWKYGLLNWAFAALGAWFMVDSYQRFFTG